MKQNNPSTPASIDKKYVPYGINGEYFVYDNEAGHTLMGHSGGNKKAIQKKCDELNLSIDKEVLEMRNISALDAVNILTAKGFNPLAMEELYKALESFVTAVDIISENAKTKSLRTTYQNIKNSLTYSTAVSALKNSKL